MLNEHDVKKIRNKWQSYFGDMPGCTGFQVSKHGVSIWLLNESFRNNFPDSIEGVDVDYKF